MLVSGRVTVPTRMTWHFLGFFWIPPFHTLEAGAWVENPTMFSNEYAADMVWRLKKEPRGDRPGYARNIFGCFQQ